MQNETRGSKAKGNKAKRNKMKRKRTKQNKWIHQLLSYLQNVVSTTSTSHILSTRHQHNLIFSYTIKTSSAQPRLVTYFPNVISTTSSSHILSKRRQHNFVFSPAIKTSSAQLHRINTVKTSSAQPVLLT